MKLKYRGIDYKSQTIDKQLERKPIPTPVDKCGAGKLKNRPLRRSIKPIYFTYRGVSYIKNIESNTHQRILLDDRQ